MAEKPIGLAILIDDNEIDHRLYRRVIERSGLVDRLATFFYAEDALEFLATDERPDVVFLDINMPRMTGFEFLDAALDRLGDRFRKIVVVVLTTSQDPQDKARADRYDIVKEYLSKPLTVDDVRSVATLLRTA